MDLTKLSDGDLMALKAGDLTKMSDAGLMSMKGGAPAKSRKSDPSLDAAGAVLRGAGSIGATLLSPIDWAARKLNNGKPVNVGGYDIVGQDRRAGMDAALDTAGVDRNSLTFGGVKLATEVAGTLGVGGGMANAVGRVAPAAAAKFAPVVDAMRTAGFQAGGAMGLAGVGARAVGGGITGGASMAMVDPKHAGTGAAIGAALPGAMQLAGKIGSGVGGVLRGPVQSPALANAITKARGAGYVIPPTQANPTLVNRTLEGFSGKITTAQNASTKNQVVSNRLAAEALGLPGDTKLTADVLTTVRKSAGTAYDAIGSTGTITPGANYTQALDSISAPYLKAAQGFPNAKPSPVLELVDSLRSPSFNAASAVEKIKQLRTAADDAFRAGNTDVARASKSAAKALEDAIESHLSQGIRASSGVLEKATPGPVDGFVRLYRGESQTTGFNDVFKASGLQEFARPKGMIGNRYTDKLNVAEYYKNSYGKNAAIKYVDVPDSQLQNYLVGANEFIVEPSRVLIPGGDKLLQAFRDARQLIAKTYTVQKALNPASGSVDAGKLAAELKKGKPLTGELRQAGEFAAQFPKAAQTIEGMGSLPQTSPLDWIPAGALSMATSNPLLMMGVAARPMSRSAALSPMVQNRLLQSPPSQMVNAFLTPAQQAALRAGPLSLSDR